MRARSQRLPPDCSEELVELPGGEASDSRGAGSRVSVVADITAAVAASVVVEAIAEAGIKLLRL